MEKYSKKNQLCVLEHVNAKVGAFYSQKRLLLLRLFTQFSLFSFYRTVINEGCANTYREPYEIISDQQFTQPKSLKWH